MYVHETQFKIQTAEENLPCYKSLYKGGQAQNMDYTYRRFQLNVEDRFEFAALHEASLSPRPYYCEVSQYIKIEYGFHSRVPAEVKRNSDKLHLFIIPKGAKYVSGYENDCNPDGNKHDNYVSDKIIYFGKNNWFNRILAKVLYNVSF